MFVGFMFFTLFLILAAGLNMEEEPFTLSKNIISEQRLQSLDEYKVKQTIHNIPDVFKLVGIINEKWVYLKLDGLYYIYNDNTKEMICIGDKMPPKYVP